MHLLRAFGEQARGFYIDIGAGHPVYDNVSFAFYLRGWRGITVEPNPWLAQLSEAVRPRDVRIAVAGRRKARPSDLLSRRGFSWIVDHGRSPRPRGRERIRQALAGDDHAGHDLAGAVRAARAGRHRFPQDRCGRRRARCAARRRLAALPAEGDRVGGAGAGQSQPAWEAWEPLLLHSGYGFAYFDGLNRYYVAAEHAALAGRLAAAPTLFDNVTPFSQFKPALDDATHPDHGLAQLLSGEDMVRLPLMPFDALAQRLMNALHPGGQDQQAQPADIAALHQWLFGIAAPSRWADELRLAPGATIGGLYRSAVATELVSRRLRTHLGQHGLVTVPSLSAG